MQRWEIGMMLAGAILLVASFLYFGFSLVNFVGAAMILFPPVLFIIRYVEGFWQGSPEQ